MREQPTSRGRALPRRIGMAAILTLAGAAAVAAAEPQDLFVANGCNKCHSIEKYDITRTIDNEKMRGPDLSEVGDRHDAEWIMAFMMKTVELHDKKHLNNYKGTKKDLQAVVDWLARQKAGSQ